MMKKKKILIYFSFIQFLICLYLPQVKAFELKIDNPNYIPSEFGGIIRAGCGSAHKEIEYESNLGIIDEQIYKTNDCQLFTGIVPWKRLFLGIDLHYDIDQDYELKFGPQSDRSGDPSYFSSASGILDPDVVIAYEFRSKIDNWNQQVYFKMNPFDIEEEPRKIFRGGHDIALEYRFARQYGEDSLYGSLFSHYFGKKNYYQPGDSRKSVKEAYTEVGIDLGYIYRLSDKWSFQLGGTFALSSDYDVITPEITKTADKGYLIEASIAINYFLSPEWMGSVTHTRGSRIYNATNEDRSQEIDYEVEDESLFFSLTYMWDFSRLIERVKAL